MPTDNQYKYFAFISFQHQDAKQALAVQRAIENYRLPTAILKEHSDLPTRIRPCFCYLNDMHHTEEIMHELKQRMEQSRYLIIVCSPRAAHSTYINAGIDYFVSLGRRDKIIPVIIEGIPYSDNPATECFPDSLKRHFPKHQDPLQDHSILGINFNEQGAGSRRQTQQRALLMIVARMLELEYNGLALRERQRRKKITLVTSLGVIALLLFIGWLGFLLQVKSITVKPYDAHPNLFLPQADGSVLTLAIDNEIKSDTLSDVDTAFLFNNIPPNAVGKEVKLSFRSTYYYSFDTTQILQPAMLLPIERDTDYFGKIDIGLYGQLPQDELQLYVENHAVEITNGRIQFQMPLPDQRAKYHIYSIPQYINDTIYMPCGPSDIIEIHQ